MAVFGRWLLDPALGDHVPYALVYAGVVFSAICLGLGPSLVASVIGLVSVNLLFLAPRRSLALSSLHEVSETLTYIGGCVLIVVVGEVTRRSKSRLQTANHKLALREEALRTFNQELEKRVRERTAELEAAEEAGRQLGAQVLKMQDDERRRIARDLHDSVGQAAALLNINLARLQRSANLSRDHAEILSDSKTLAEEVSDEVRTISHLLHPPLLDDMGLPAALKWYVEGFSKRSGIDTHLELSRDFGRLPADCEIAVFRIIQEALTNVHRHSQSARADVRVTWTRASVALEIADRGMGIPLHKQRTFAAGGTMGVGLNGMRERVAQLGGRMELHSGDYGTIIRAILPLALGTERLEDSVQLVDAHEIEKTSLSIPGD
jgi:signal transduction histidine kinase